MDHFGRRALVRSFVPMTRIWCRVTRVERAFYRLPVAALLGSRMHVQPLLRSLSSGVVPSDYQPHLRFRYYLTRNSGAEGHTLHNLLYKLQVDINIHGKKKKNLTNFLRSHNETKYFQRRGYEK